jgi:CRP-like cAMP-binding protein
MVSIETLARDLHLLDRLSSRDLAQLSAAMEQRTFTAGSFLFRRGGRPADLYYLLSGEVELIDAFDREVATLAAERAPEPQPLPEHLPSCHDARATVDSRVLCVNRTRLEALLGSAPAAAPPRTATPSAPDWQDAFLRARGYARVPADRMQEAISRMQPRNAQTQDLIIRQGEPADYFYVMAEGRCEVLQDLADVPEPVKVAEYGPGASLGEDALISGNPRNATVRMLSQGRLMRLAGQDFRELLQPWLARGVDAAAAVALLARGARWLDVRLPAESGSRRLPNSLRVPHPVVRARLFTADPALTYIVVCAAQRESPVIAYMLSKYGIDARYLKGGIAAVPEEFLA